MSDGKTIQIRDMRTRDWVWSSKQLLFHPDIDGNTYKVYCGLSAYSDNETQKSYPSLDTLTRKLNIKSRVTIIKSIRALEKCGAVYVDRVTGQHNIYYLLELGQKMTTPPPREIHEPVETPDAEDAPKKKTPKEISREFFKGIQDLKNKVETPESVAIASFLKAFREKYPTAAKELIWAEVQRFERYWTEKNSTGRKERWEGQDTFEVDRRLGNWFSKKKEFEKSTITKPKKRIV